MPWIPCKRSFGIANIPAAIRDASILLRRQTYSKRYDFFDRFRSFSSTAIDRGIGIDRFGVEKTTFDFCTEMYGAPAKHCSGPENRNASILLGKHIADVMIFSIVFDRVRAPRSIEASGISYTPLRLRYVFPSHRSVALRITVFPFSSRALATISQARACVPV